MTQIDKNPRQITRLRVKDQKKLEELATELTYNSTTNTVEVGSNLEVNGQAIFNADIKSYNGAGLFLYDNVGDSENVNIWAGVSDKVLYIDYGNEGNPDLDVSVQIPLSSDSTVLTTSNTKTLFGNSLYGTGNIDLYKHYLHIQGGSSGAGLYDFYIVIQSSSNVDCSSTSGATKKLRTLLKVSPAIPRMYETGVCGPVKMPEQTENYNAERPCALYWDGSLLYVRNGVADFEITLIEDKVETL